MTSPVCESGSRHAIARCTDASFTVGVSVALPEETEEDIRAILAHAFASSAVELERERTTTQRIGEYEVGRRLGKGNFAEVRAAVHSGSKAKVALKLVEKFWSDEDSGRRHSSSATAGGSEESKEEQHVVREAAILRLSNRSRGLGCRGGCHPNIVRSFDFIDTDAFIGVALELIPGKPLSDFVSSYSASASASASKSARALSTSRWVERRITPGKASAVECDSLETAPASVAHPCGALPEKLTRRIARQILSAVEFMHGANIAHRDIKLENIVISENLDVKIIDFGCAAVFDERSRLKTRCGSAAFMSPEMHSGGEYCGPDVDVWSSGVVIFSMLAGHLPFDEGSNGDLAAFHTAASTSGYTIHLPRSTSEDAWSFLASIFQHDPKHRCAARDLASHAWLCAGSDRHPGGLSGRLPRNRVLASRNTNKRASEKRQRRRVSEAALLGNNGNNDSDGEVCVSSTRPSILATAAFPLIVRTGDDASRSKKVAAWCDDADTNAADSDDDCRPLCAKPPPEKLHHAHRSMRLAAAQMQSSAAGDHYDGDASADEDRELNDLVNVSRGCADIGMRGRVSVKKAPSSRVNIAGLCGGDANSFRLPSIGRRDGCLGESLPTARRVRGGRSPLGVLTRGTREAAAQRERNGDTGAGDADTASSTCDGPQVAAMQPSTELPSTSRFLPPVRTLGYRRER
eukprot:Opistho-2@4693